MSAIAWMLEPPRPPESWPADARRRHGFHTLGDDPPYSEADLRAGRSPEEAAKLIRGGRPTLDETKAMLARAAATVAHPSLTPEYRRARREAEAAARGEVFAPLEPGQKRRRRLGPDGQPVKRPRKAGKHWYSRDPREPAAESVYKGPVRAPGEMTYGAAVRLTHRALDGELVDMDELARAHETIAAARAAGVGA